MLDIKFSYRLYNILQHQIFLSDVIAHFLIDYMAFASLSFIDIDSESHFSFIPMNKYYKLCETYDDTSEVFWKCNRQKIKFGRLISKLIKSNKENLQTAIDVISEHFPDAKKISIDRHIQIFSDRLKGLFISLSDKTILSKIEFLSGEAIRDAYLETNYVDGSGDLNRSCMRQKEKQSFLDIYVENPEVCNLLVLKDDSGKIKIRSILWTLTDGTKY